MSSESSQRVASGFDPAAETIRLPSNKEFCEFQRLIERTTGIHLSKAKKALLVGRLGTLVVESCAKQHRFGARSAPSSRRGRPPVRFRLRRLGERLRSPGFRRNALIYFSPATMRRVVNQLLDLIAPDGYLFLGHAESVTSLADRVRHVRLTVYAPLPSPGALSDACAIAPPPTRQTQRLGQSRRAQEVNL